MSYTYHGTTDLIALPNRTVQTYPSGLVRVERSFVCRKAQAATYRRAIKVGEKMPLDDGAPAIDGLYIFPDPSEVVRDDGFVEFRVTAYGRTNKTGQQTAQAPIPGMLDLNIGFNSLNLSYDPSDSTSSKTELVYYKESIPIDTISVIYKFCIPANTRYENPNILDIGGVFLSGTDISIFTQSYLNIEVFPFLNSGITPSTLERISPKFYSTIDAFTRTNFGKFDEISVTYTPRAGAIYFGTLSDLGSTPAKQIINSVIDTYNGAVVNLLKMPFSDGVQVTISGVTQYIPYDRIGVVSENTFTLSIINYNEYATLAIGGLSSETLYSASIAAVNQNGPGAAEVIPFRTKGRV